MVSSEKSRTERPDFLTVLCILTFIGQGYVIMKNFMGLFAVSMITNLEPIVEDAISEFDYDGPFEKFIYDMLEIALSSIDNFLTLILGKLLLAGMVLYGAILMWNLKKLGFFFYVAGKVLFIAFPPSLVDFNSVSVFSILFQGIFASIFIVMYAINLKALK